MSFIKTGAVALVSLGLLAGCEASVGASADMNIESGLSYDDFERQYGTDRASTVAIDADGDGMISENEWQAAGY